MTASSSDAPRDPRAEPWAPNFAADGRIALSLAISDYDHTRDLTAGPVRPQGIQLTSLSLPIEEIFHRFTRYREWEVSEMSMGKYSALLSQGDRSIWGIPVFPSRVFRHSSIYVRRGGPVREVKDLRGRRVGLPEWAQTAAVYSRGLLTEEYGLRLQEIDWVQAGVNQPGRREKVALRLPEGMRLTRRPDASLDAMLLAGEIDAVLSAHAPQSFEAGNPAVARLFEDYQPLEEAYFGKTGIFPIMHVVALRRAVLDRFPWVAKNLLDAFEEAKRRSLYRSREITASRFPVPWITEAATRAQKLFGDDPMPYGIAANRPTLDAFLRFAHEQGVCHRRLTPEDLFPPEVQTSVKI